MNEYEFRKLISGQTTGGIAHVLRTALLALSLLYGLGVAFRNLLFDAGLRRIRRVRLPVICVGNLTTGGTGKTPVTAFVVSMLQAEGLRPGIISRGYRSLDGQMNDEKLVLELLCPGVPHLQNRSRIAAAAALEATGLVDVIVMDDGFQHRLLHRDLDLVLVDATCPSGYGKVLPRGLLREPMSGLRRASAVLITRADLVTEQERKSVCDLVIAANPALGDRICCVSFCPAGLVDRIGHTYPIDDFKRHSVLLICGIGNPEAFETTCRLAGLHVAGTMWFPDHHHYSAADCVKIAEESQRLGASLVITTLKDLVKIPEPANLLALSIGAVMQDPQQYQFLLSLIRNVIRGGKRKDVDPQAVGNAN